MGNEVGSETAPVPSVFKEGWLRLNKKTPFLIGADGVVSKRSRSHLFRLARRALLLRTTPSGVDRRLFLRVADALCSNSGRDRTSAFCYAVGWTQHTIGVQYIRTASIIQLLLGNIGRPGGGILALRGHASIQG